MHRIYPFLARDFAAGGVLAGKEIYAFEPGTITAVEGDTLALTLVNPEDDEHSFVLPGLAVDMPAQSTVTATYLAGRPGIYRFTCAVPAHLPYMVGTLVVLSASSFAAR
jgi:plastocyanin